MTATAIQATAHISYTGTLTENAHMRQVMCDKRGHMRPAVCMLVRVRDSLKPLHIKQFCADGTAAEALAKTYRKGTVIEVHVPLSELQISGFADFIEVQTPAPDKPVAAPKAAVPNPKEPEFTF